MLRLRARDIRALVFVGASSLALLVGTYFALRSVIVAAALTAAWLAWVLTRPRLRRVIKRLRGESDGWTGYYLD
jgi:hypothetical protein